MSQIKPGDYSIVSLSTLLRLSILDLALGAGVLVAVMAFIMHASAESTSPRRLPR
ncbi:hypothetical protein KIP88_41710 [Bradyrhizobium sp. SRL28]|uniref:hypothetical protein n=1 Tax=Bradyrhizobium sp. SRL28 TaxID=2836178 RepID=UPI001BDDF612|nr:hypothetical protein [Bradyrhizobium sp. SRL28]MBT1516917.1 hypothetical protein [Bradyrhizobium sp. SRL28]